MGVAVRRWWTALGGARAVLALICEGTGRPSEAVSKLMCEGKGHFRRCIRASMSSEDTSLIPSLEEEGRSGNGLVGGVRLWVSVTRWGQGGDAGGKDRDGRGVRELRTWFYASDCTSLAPFR